MQLKNLHRKDSLLTENSSIRMYQKNKMTYEKNVHKYDVQVEWLIEPSNVTQMRERY